VSGHLYIEGAESKEDKILCRQAFRKILERAGLGGQMPRLTACGSRNSAFDDFKTAHAQGRAQFVGLLVDSEDPIEQIEATWEHLFRRDHWAAPAGAADEQVLLMVTCMESWVAADRQALQRHYGNSLQVNALPSMVNLESRTRGEVQRALEHATRNCKGPYRKGRRSFEALEQLEPAVLEAALPSFARVLRILRQRLA
jgi:hypothetical protein